MSYDVILKEVGAAKLGVVKTIIDLTGLGLKDAKDLVDSVDPRTKKTRVIKRTSSLAEAESIKTALENAAATVEIMNNTTLETIGTTSTTFKVVSSGSIVQISTTSPGLIGITGEPGLIGIQGEHSFRINYRAKDGEDKTEVIQAPTLAIAITKITDLVSVNYHMGG